MLLSASLPEICQIFDTDNSSKDKQLPVNLQQNNRTLSHPKRDIEWFKTTSSKLKILLSQLAQFTSCPNFKVN